MSRKVFLGATTALTSLYISSLALGADSTAPRPETIVVTASPLTQDPDALAAIVESVDRGEILKQGGANLADALANIPGVTGSGFASGASRPVIRGFDSTRVKVLENGIGSFDVSDVGPDHGVPIDPLSAERIEVVRGAATLRYGSQAIGGVVNAINNRVPTALPEKPLQGEVNGTYGTNADARQGSGSLDGRLGQFAIHADGFDRHTGDYDTPRGEENNSFFHGDGYSLGSSYFFGDSRVGAAVVHYDSKYGIPGEDTYIDMRQTKEMLRSSFALGLGPLQTLSVEGGYADYQHSERDPSGAPQSTFKDREWDGRAEGLFGAMGPLSGAALGVQVENRDFSALGEGADYLLPTTTKTAAAFFFAEAPLSEKLRLQTGARIESVKLDGTPASGQPTSRDFTPGSVSAGLVFDASKAVRLGLTLSSAARAPGQTELFARGPHDGPGTFETGDPTLKVERANSLEGSVRVRLDKVRFDGSVWGAKFRDYIYGQLTGRTCDDEGNCVAGDSEGLRQLNYGQRDAKFWGVEGKSTIDLAESSAGKLQGEVLADYVRATLTGGENVPRIPPYHVGAGLDWDAGAYNANVLVKYSAAQNEVATAETRTAGFVSIDAQVGWRPWSAFPDLQLALVGRNLTDSVQRNAVALNKDEVILPGRDVRLLVRASF